MFHVTTVERQSHNLYCCAAAAKRPLRQTILITCVIEKEVQIQDWLPITNVVDWVNAIVVRKLSRICN